MAGLYFQPQIGIEAEPQKGDFWCWAAVAVSLDRFFRIGSRRSQCGVATQVLHVAGGCCQGSAARPECDQATFLEDALEAVDQMAGGPSNPSERPSTRASQFALIKEQIDLGLPVCIRVAWNRGAGEGHFLMITGYNEVGRRKYVHVEDSIWGSGFYSLSDFANSYQDDEGRWTDSYLVRG